MADLSKPRVVAVGGPTASGKTALSVALARAFDGEIINADSMQIYKNLDVGTAKPSAEERQGIPHYLLDFLPPETPYSVADFTAAADPLIRDITARGRLPLVVGGTGLYLESLIRGTDFAAARRLGHTALHALSLPTVWAPETAGEALARTVQAILQEREGTI